MSFKPFASEEDGRSLARVARLEGYHTRALGVPMLLLFLALGAFVAWAMTFRVDEVAKATGEVIASSRVQVIQSVDGGVLSELRVKEGDRVKPGQLLARLEQTRVGASVGEIEARVYALKAKALRLQAEAAEKPAPVFPADFPKKFADTAAGEQALFRQRRLGLDADLAVMKEAVQLANKELEMVSTLHRAGDASGTELLRTQRGVNDAQTRLIARQNKFLEDARADLSKVEDDLAQNEQVLTKKRQEQQDSSYVAQVAGIVKNVRVTTVGGVLRAGDEILQIVPVDDELVVEVKVKPADIARVRKELEATIRFDPFDYTIFGSVKAKVIYVSADTLKEEAKSGTETYYRVHVIPVVTPVVSSTGRPLSILPGMTAQVDIRTGERTVMEYLLKPLRKTVSESFGER